MILGDGCDAIQGEHRGRFEAFHSGANVIKLFTSVISVCNKLVLCQPSVIFVGMARSLPQSIALERNFSRVGSA
jgi:hypothetical protein